MTDIAGGPGVPGQPSTMSGDRNRRFYLAAWRWHFYAGLYVAPFLIMLAVTGLIMMYVAFFDGRDGDKIRIETAGTTLSLEQQGAAALSSVQDARLVEWIGPANAQGASVFRVSSPSGAFMVAVNPYSAEVIDVWDRRAGWYDFASDIHGTLLIGTLGDRLIEIAASFGIVLVVTGLYLWWPRGGASLLSAFVPDLSLRSRGLWKNLHQTVGLYCSLLLVVFLVSGLAWAGIWGEKFVQAWSTFPAEKWENVPLSDETHAHMNHGATKDVPWGLEQTPMPASGSDVGAAGVPVGDAVNADSIAKLGHAIGFHGRFRLHYPGDENAVWTLSRDSMSNDSSDPTSDRTVHVDQHTGKILADVRFSDYSLAAKSMAVGIAFHEGDLGVWNLILNTVFCLSVIFVSVSGVVMWWIRRPKAAGMRLLAPRTPDHLPHWRGAMLMMLVLSLAFPLVGLTLISVLALDLLIVSRIPALKKAVG